MKFDTKQAEEMYTSFSDDEIGSVHELGWAGRYDAEQIILTEDNLGFVETHTFDSRREFEQAWLDVVRQYDDYWSAMTTPTLV